MSLNAYVKHILLHPDRKFRLDISVKFHVFNVLQKREVSLHTTLLVRQPKFFNSNSANQIRSSTTHSSLVKICEAFDKNRAIKDENLKILLNYLSSTGSRIQGSVYSRKSYRREIHGLMVHYGMPAIFVTLSPADIVSNLPSFPTARTRGQIVAEDPVAAAQFFNIVIDAFTSILLGYGTQDRGILGHISSSYVHISFVSFHHITEVIWSVN